MCLAFFNLFVAVPPLEMFYVETLSRTKWRVQCLVVSILKKNINIPQLSHMLFNTKTFAKYTAASIYDYYKVRVVV